MAKKSLCFIGQAESVCEYIQQEISRFLSQYLDVETWSLQMRQFPPEHFLTHDLYLVSSATVLNMIRSFVPADREIFVAARTVNTEKLHELLELESGTQALVVATNEETSWVAINLIKSFGINYLNLSPYYPGIPHIPSNVQLAITMGLQHLLPSHIEKTIDLGVKGVDLSTFAKIIDYCGIPMEVLDQISHYYLEALLNLTRRQQKTARTHEVLKKNVEVIINTVSEAIIAVNAKHEITVFNDAAAKVFNITDEDAIGKTADFIIPELELPDDFQSVELGNNSEVITIYENDYVLTLKPIIDPENSFAGAVATLQPVVEVQELESKVRRALKKNGNVAKHTFAEIVGNSSTIRRSVELAKKFAQSELTILLEGESGTGKELFAQAIHNSSKRRNNPFVALNFAAFTESLVESELFGYEEGAFTGAKKGGKRGLFEEAHTGTIFLDEIGDASPEVQKKLLRVLEEREIRRVGGSIVTPVDVRIIAATNKNLEEMVKHGEYRGDLFFRLCALPIFLPPLRERKDDILGLFNLLSRRVYRGYISLDTELQDFLIHYNWPGNVRELENVVKYITSVAGSTGSAGIEDLPPYFSRSMEWNNFEEGPAHVPRGETCEAVVGALERSQSLELVATLLYEIKNYSLLNKGVGRKTLLKKLETSRVNVSDHRVKQSLAMLEHMGFIQSGITRQGSRITQKGEELLIFLGKR